MRKYTFDDIKDIIVSRNNDVKTYKIAKKYNTSEQSIHQITYLYRKFLKGNLKGISERDKGYFEKIRGGASEEQAPTFTVLETKVEMVHSTQEDDLSKLQLAFDTLQAVVVRVIENEANRRSEKKIKGIKEKYEQELQKVQSIMIEAKESNIAGTLRRAWNNNL